MGKSYWAMIKEVKLQYIYWFLIMFQLFGQKIGFTGL